MGWAWGDRWIVSRSRTDQGAVGSQDLGQQYRWPQYLACYAHPAVGGRRAAGGSVWGTNHSDVVTLRFFILCNHSLRGAFGLTAFISTQFVARGRVAAAVLKASAERSHNQPQVPTEVAC